MHSSYDEKCQRLFNAIEPNSYIRPHRHSNSEGGETLVAVRGGFVLIIFKDGCEFDRVHPFGVGAKFQSELLCVTIPDGLWHAVLAIYPGSVLFEVKTGPFVASCSKELAPWAPSEESKEGVSYHSNLCHAAVARLCALDWDFEYNNAVFIATNFKILLSPLSENSFIFMYCVVLFFGWCDADFCKNFSTFGRS